MRPPKNDEFRKQRRMHAIKAADRARSCIEKMRYGRRSAYRAARILRDKGDHVHAYPCNWCKGWHVGHSNMEDID